MSLRQLKFKPKLLPNNTKPRDINKGEQNNEARKEEGGAKNGICTNLPSLAKNINSEIQPAPIPNVPPSSERNTIVQPLSNESNEFPFSKTKVIDEQPLHSEGNLIAPLKETFGVSLRQLKFKPKLQSNHGSNLKRGANRGEKALCDKNQIPIETGVESPPSKKKFIGSPLQANNILTNGSSLEKSHLDGQANCIDPLLPRIEKSPSRKPITLLPENKNSSDNLSLNLQTNEIFLKASLEKPHLNGHQANHEDSLLITVEESPLRNSTTLLCENKDTSDNLSNSDNGIFTKVSSLEKGDLSDHQADHVDSLLITVEISPSRNSKTLLCENKDTSGEKGPTVKRFNFKPNFLEYLSQRNPNLPVNDELNHEENVFNNKNASSHSDVRRISLNNLKLIHNNKNSKSVPNGTTNKLASFNFSASYDSCLSESHEANKKEKDENNEIPIKICENIPNKKDSPISPFSNSPKNSFIDIEKEFNEIDDELNLVSLPSTSLATEKKSKLLPSHKNNRMLNNGFDEHIKDNIHNEEFIAHNKNFVEVNKITSEENKNNNLHNSEDIKQKEDVAALSGKPKSLMKFKRFKPNLTNHPSETVPSESKKTGIFQPSKKNIENEARNKVTHLLSLGLETTKARHSAANNHFDKTNKECNVISAKESSLDANIEETGLSTSLDTRHQQEGKKALPKLFKLKPKPQLSDKKSAVKSSESVAKICADKEDHSVKAINDLPKSSSASNCLNLSRADVEDTTNYSTETNKVKSDAVSPTPKKKKKKKKKKEEDVTTEQKDDHRGAHDINMHKSIEPSISTICKSSKKHKSMDRKSRAIYGSKSIRACHQKAPFKPKLTDRSNRALYSSTYGKMCSEAKEQFAKKFKDKVPDSSKLTMMDLIFYNPSTNPMPQSDNKILEETPDISPEQNSTADKGKDNDKENSSNTSISKEKGETNDASEVPVPQLKLSADGKIVISQESLVIKQSLGEISANIEFDNENNLNRRKRKTPRPRQGWSHEDTVKFYKALNSIGADFETMKSVFPNRSRGNLKSKFKKEERLHGELVDKVMYHHAEFNVDDVIEELEFERTLEEVNESGKKKKSKVDKSIVSHEDHLNLMGRCKKKKKEDTLSTKEITNLLKSDNKTEEVGVKEKGISPSSKCVRTRRLASQCLDDILRILKCKNTAGTVETENQTELQVQATDDDSNEHIVISTNIEYENMKYTKYIAYNPNNLENPVEINETIAHE